MRTQRRNADLLQMNLALPADASADLPHDQKTELELALAELFIQAWTEATACRDTGVDNELEIDS